MWTGGKPPLIPQEALKKPDTTSSGVAFRSNLVNSELEALKQRGLAKILNKHFTETTKKLAEEKAAADAALADLEQRKANTSEFQFSGNMELSPLDSMYVSVNAWRSECRRKERETLLLYQRYVDKFGSTGQVRLPETTISRPTNKNKEARSWMVKDDGSVASLPPAAPPAAPPGQLVPTIAAEIERTLDEYIQKGALSVPSVEVLGMDKTFQTARTKEESEFRNYYRRQLEQRGVDAKSPAKSLDKKDTFVGPGWVASLGPGSEAVMSPSRLSSMDGNMVLKHSCGNSVPSTKHSADDEEYDRNDDDDEEDDEYDQNLPLNGAYFADDASVVSGLTSIHSHITRSVIQDCERSVYEFLKEERDHIQHIIQEEDCADAEIREGNIQVTKATEEAENMVKQMEDILTEYQLKHIEETASKHEARRFNTDNPDEIWMVYYDEFYQQEYYHELNSNRTQWEPPAPPISGNNSGKDGSSISGTSPDNTVAASAVPDNASISSTKAVFLSSNDVMPEHGSGMLGTSRRLSYESRIAQYRKKRRLERKRKILAMLFLLIACIVGGVTYCAFHRPKLLASVSTTVENYFDDILTGSNNSKKPINDKIKNFPEEYTSFGISWEFEYDVVSKALKFDPNETISACQHGYERYLVEKAAQLAEQEERRKEKQLEEREHKAMMERPWACNIPFAYLVHPRCMRLAEQNPFFDLQELILFMLQ